MSEMNMAVGPLGSEKEVRASVSVPWVGVVPFVLSTFCWCRFSRRLTNYYYLHSY